MNDTLLIMVGFFVMGLLIGLAEGRRKGMKLERDKKPEPITPTCPCEHIWGAHKEGGRCLASVKRVHYTVLGERNGHEYASCACTKYHGPTIINNDFFHPGTVYESD